MNTKTIFFLLLILSASGFISPPIALCAGIIFGLAPALQSSRMELSGVLKEGGRNTGGNVSQRLRSGLVMTEIALAVVLLVGAGMLLNGGLEEMVTALRMATSVPAATYIA